MTLFTACERDDPWPAQNGEPYFRALDRIAGGYWDTLRATLEDWFSHIPPAAGEHIRSRFRSDDLRSTMGAFWEIYLHETFVRRGYEVELEPAVPGGRRHPDFLVHGPGTPFFVEATIIGDSDEDVASERRRGWLFDAINETPDPRFWLHVVSIDAESQGYAPKRRLQIALRRWLSSLGPDDARWPSEGVDLSSMYPWVDERSGWAVTFAALPRTRVPGEHTPAIGIYPVQTFYGGLEARLREALDKKATRYGELSSPFVIAVLLLGLKASWDDIEPVLYGRTQEHAYLGPAGPPQVHMSFPYRLRDGYWLGPSGPTNTRVSAVLAAVNLSPHLAGKVSPRLWLNPFPRFPLPPGNLPWETRLVASSVARSEVDPAEVLGLPQDWPRAGDPFGLP